MGKKAAKREIVIWHPPIEESQRLMDEFCEQEPYAGTPGDWRTTPETELGDDE